ncbi:MAG TPA: hypothetical protein VF051_03000 [Hyphomicrobiaceae bacterium]
MVVLMVAAAFAHFSADPAAVVVQINGSVQIQRAGKAATPATVGASLVPGDKVVVGTGAKAVLLYKTGKMVPTSSSVTIEDAQRDKPGGLFNQTVNTLTQVATTNARTQPNRQGMIRPIQGEPTPIAPRNLIKVADLHPTFSWMKLDDATGYTVQVRRLEPFPGKPERFTAGNVTSWTYPADATPLIPGGVYEWTVAASTGRPATVQRFRLVNAEDFSRIAGTLNELATAGIDPLGDGLFLTALAYRDAGLMYEAGRLLDRLESSGAPAGREFYLLRGEIFDALGDLDGAAKAFATADSR